MTAKRTPSTAKDVRPTDLTELLAMLEKLTSSLLAEIKEARKPGELRQDPVNVLRVLNAAREGVSRLNGLAATFDSFQLALKDAAERQLLELDSTIRSACQERGWRVDGQWPTLYVERAVAVEFNEQNRSVAVAGTLVEKCSADAISSALEPLVATLIPKGFSARAFVLQLAAAYEDSRGTRTQVSVFDVYRSMVVRSQRPHFWRDARPSSFTSLTADQFRARLTRAMEEGVIGTPDGSVLRLLAPLDPKDALFLYQPAEQRFGYVGRIEFIRPSEAHV